VVVLVVVVVVGDVVVVGVVVVVGDVVVVGVVVLVVVVVGVVVVVDVVLVVVGGGFFFPRVPLSSYVRLGVRDTPSMKKADVCRREPPIFSTSVLAFAGVLKRMV
jgi:hypothetical protein